MKKFLLVTEKYITDDSHRDGGSFLVKDLTESLAGELDIMQFSSVQLPSINCTYNYVYPIADNDRFKRRLKNASFIAEQVKKVSSQYEKIIFIHVSLQFGITKQEIGSVQIITFPMFSGVCYRISGEIVPEEYLNCELNAFKSSDYIFTPSYFEKEILIKNYKVPEGKIRVIPRGINLTNFSASPRTIEGQQINFCALTSIKKQKNIIELLRFFKKCTDNFPSSKLKIIGAVQDKEYNNEVLKEVQGLGIENLVEFKGYCSSEQIAEELEGQHINLCLSKCETFGRSIYETLALGIPNLCLKDNNATYDFLSSKGCVWFFDTHDEGISVLKTGIENYQQASRCAVNTGQQFDRRILQSLLVARLKNEKKMIVSDFDGTIFHKDNPERTGKCIDAFNKYPLRVVCSSRGLDNLTNECRELGLKPDYFIAWSGALIGDSSGNILWVNPFSEEEKMEMNDLRKKIVPIYYKNLVLQYMCSSEEINYLPKSTYHEIYGDKVYISKSTNAKTSAIVRLLQHIKWKGDVVAFGDRHYDMEFLKYFDGTFIQYPITNKLQIKQKEIVEENG